MAVRPARGRRAARVPRAIELAYTMWREVVARTQSRIARVVTASDVRAHTTVGAAFKGVPSQDRGLRAT